MRAKTLLINSASKIASTLSFNLISLLTLPLYLKIYGEELYGIYILAMSFNASLAVLDLGAGSGLKRFIAQYTADKDLNKVSQALSHTLSTTIIIAIFNAVLIYCLSFYTGELFNISSQNKDVATAVFQIAAAYSIIFWLTKFTKAIFDGYQLHWVYSLSNVINMIAIILIYIWAYIGNLDFLLFNILTFSSSIIPLIVHFAIINRKKLIKAIPIHLGIKKGYLKSEYFTLNKDLFFIALIGFFSLNVDRYILGFMMSSTAVTIYFIINKPSIIVKTISSFMFSAVEPMVAKEHTLGNTEFVHKLKREGTLLHFILVSPIIIISMLLLKPFLNLWVGHEYDEYIIWGQLGLFSLMFRPYFNTTNRVIINTGNPKLVRNINFIGVVANFIVSVAATYFMGLGGVIIGTFVQNIIQIPLYYYHYKDFFGHTDDLYITKNFIPYLTVIGVMAIFANTYLDYFALTHWINFTIFACMITAIFYLIGVIFYYKKFIVYLKWKS